MIDLRLHDLKQKALSEKIIRDQLKTIIKSNSLLCGILKEYCSGMNDNPEYYETQRNSEAQAIMFLKDQGRVRIIKGSFPETKKIKFKFIEGIF